MPLMPNGNYEEIGSLRGRVFGLRNKLAVAADTDRLAHPVAVEWQRRLVEAEAAIADYEETMETV